MSNFLDHLALGARGGLSLIFVPPLCFLRNARTNSTLRFHPWEYWPRLGNAYAKDMAFHAPVSTGYLLRIAMARPQWRNVQLDRSVSGIDILIALDISESMKTGIILCNSAATFRREKAY